MPADISGLDMRTRLTAALIECPVLGGNPDGCVLAAVRRRPLSEKLAWIANLSDEDCEDIFLKYVGGCAHDSREKRPAR